MADLCAYPPCNCTALAREQYCGDVCEMLGANLVGSVIVTSDVLMEPEDRQVLPRCACGHDGCGGRQVSSRVN